MSFRTLALGFGLLFVVAAAVQWNDPDRAGWIAIYAGAALVSGLAAFDRLPGVLGWAEGLVAAVWAATLLPTILEVAAWTGNEVEREFGGLVIAAAWSLVCARRAGTSGAPA